MCKTNERHVYTDGTIDDIMCHACLCERHGKCTPDFKCKICG